MSIRDSLLDFDIEQSQPVETGKGLVYIKQPTLKDKSLITSAGKALSKTPDLARMTAHAIMRCCVDESGAAIFTQADIPALMDAPANSWLDKVGAEIFKKLNPDADEMETDLGETASDN